MSAEDLAAFAAHVAADPALQRELLATAGHDEFVALVVCRARASGCPVGSDDVEEGLRATRRAWWARWI